MMPGIEGGVTKHMPDGKQMSIYDASMQYQKEGTPLVIIAGKEYGTGSSRDWAAKGTMLLGVKAVVAETFERIHRSNLIGMGVLPLQFLNGETRVSLGLDGSETFDIVGVAGHDDDPRRARAAHPQGGRQDGVDQGPLPHRYGGRDGVLQQRRHPALRRAEAVGGVGSPDWGEGAVCRRWSRPLRRATSPAGPQVLSAAAPAGGLAPRAASAFGHLTTGLASTRRPDAPPAERAP